MTTPLFHRHPDDTLTTLSVFQEKKRVSICRHTGILVESADGTVYRADYRIRAPWMGKLLLRRTDIPTVRPVTDREQFNATLATCIPVGTVNIDPAELRSVLEQMAVASYNPITFNCRDYCVHVLDRINRKLPISSDSSLTQGTQRAQGHLIGHVMAVDRTLLVSIAFVLLVGLVLFGVWWAVRRQRRQRNLMG